MLLTNQRHVTGGRREQILMAREKTAASAARAAAGWEVVCAAPTHTTSAVSVHALRAEKSAALLIFLYSHGGVGEGGARGLKNRLLKKPRRKGTPPFLIGNIVSIGLIPARNSLLLSRECVPVS